MLQPDKMTFKMESTEKIITVEIPNAYFLPFIFEQLKSFLTASGFHISGDIVTTDEKGNIMEIYYPHGSNRGINEQGQEEEQEEEEDDIL